MEKKLQRNCLQSWGNELRTALAKKTNRPAIFLIKATGACFCLYTFSSVQDGRQLFIYSSACTCTALPRLSVIESRGSGNSLPGINQDPPSLSLSMWVQINLVYAGVRQRPVWLLLCFQHDHGKLYTVGKIILYIRDNTKRLSLSQETGTF